MFQVVTGGSGSGKSVYAEEKVLRLKKKPRIYIATMFPFDEECHARIKRHRLQRAEKDFETIECYIGLKKLEIPKGATVLLECMSNLTANEMYQTEGAGESTVEAVMEGIRHILSQAEHLIVVTNEVFSDGIDYDPETKKYLSYLGKINAKMGELADQVTEVVYGIPLHVKGSEQDEEIVS